MSRTAANRAHDFDLVAGTEVVAVKAAARHDFAVDFHRQALVLQSQVLDQPGGIEAVRELLGLAIDDQFHVGPFYPKSCIGADSMHQ